MEKLVYVCWMPAGTAPELVGTTFRGNLAPTLLNLGVRGLELHLDDEFADTRAPVPPPHDEELPVAVVSVWLDAYDFRHDVERAIAEVSERIAGYQVIESLYGDYGRNPHSGPRTWADGERSPGIVTMAMFPQKPGMDREEFWQFWHGHQSPMSEAIQPRCRYVRNLVVRPITDDAPDFQGIVAEAWPSKSHVEDPHLFFESHGDNEVLMANITTMIEHGNAFMDMERLRSVTMSEYLVRSVGAE
jgi:hypothetical protein